MAISEQQVEERLMRMGNEARYMKATIKANDINELRKLAIKQLTKEEYRVEKSQISSYNDWKLAVKNCINPTQIYIMIYDNGKCRIIIIDNKTAFDFLKSYTFLHMNGKIPAFFLTNSVNLL